MFRVRSFLFEVTPHSRSIVVNNSNLLIKLFLKEVSVLR